jgi:glycosyltransferase involved in cell wall biosynthesis
MKRIFFAGNHFGDAGPRIVSKNYIRCLKRSVSYISFQNKALRLLEVIWKTIWCKVIIFSGVTTYDHIIILICRILRKNIIYIMHGYLKLENNINNYNNFRGERNESLLLKYSDVILCVSETFMNYIKNHITQYEHKMSFLTNGVDWEEFDKYSLNNDSYDKKRIVLIGGGRITKRNFEVCEAINYLNQKYKENYRVEVYGEYHENDQSKQIAQMLNTTFHSGIPHDQLLQLFHDSFLFVQNSEFEPFSLGVVEALKCGCSILISTNVGAKDIIPGLTNNDIISDTSDIKEIAEKVYLLSKENNNERLLKSIDRESTSIVTSANKLLLIAKKLL